MVSNTAATANVLVPRKSQYQFAGGDVPSSTIAITFVSTCAAQEIQMDPEYTHSQWTSVRTGIDPSSAPDASSREAKKQHGGNQGNQYVSPNAATEAANQVERNPPEDENSSENAARIRVATATSVTDVGDPRSHNPAPKAMTAAMVLISKELRTPPTP